MTDRPPMTAPKTPEPPRPFPHRRPVTPALSSRALLLALGTLGACSKPEPDKVPATAVTASTTPAGSAAAATSALPKASAEPKAPEPAVPYNVILIMIDSMRADMPWAGYPRDIAPWL